MVWYCSVPRRQATHTREAAAAATPGLIRIAAFGLWAYCNLDIAQTLLRSRDDRRTYLVASVSNVLLTVGLTVLLVVLLDQGVRGYLLGNYAASLLPQSQASENGCDQVVFLDSDGNVEELGGMNIIFVMKDGTVVTPNSESILEGITRESLLQLASDRGHEIQRRSVSLTEWREGVASGDIVEVFACGTAAVVTPIGMLKSASFEDAQPQGELALSLREELTDIQYGRREDRHGWLHRLDA